jgi:two-component system chemotaxis sensor kinase CheA
MIDKMTEIFLEEANDLLEKLEDLLLTLEENPTNSETISAVFRIMHTIKGSSAMFGFDEISHFTHEAESAFDEVRNGRVSVTSELITLTLRTRDQIRLLLENGDDPAVKSESTAIIAQFKNYVKTHAVNNENTTTPTVELPSTTNEKEQIKKEEPIQKENTKKIQQDKENSEETTWRITFEPAGDVFTNGTRVHALLAELADLGTATITPFFSDIPKLSAINPCVCYMSWEIILTTKKTKNDIQDVFIFLDSSSKISIEPLGYSENASTEKPKKLGEILIEKNVVEEEQVKQVLEIQKPIGEILKEKNIVSGEEVQAALNEQQHLKDISEKKNQELNAQTIKVNSEKLDKLIDLVGELVTFNARLGQLSQTIQNSVLTTLGEQGERLILELRDTTMDMRMLPIGTIFSRFRRLVRDLAGELNKDIELETEGAETELDKTVIEKLNDPLVHLIRNSVDHGIELPAVRESAGKSSTGKVTLKAQHAGAFVLITIEDDGAGLDKNRIKAKAIERGLITATDELSEQELCDIIFMPGFSTASSVTSVSGRGVGMDVVKKDITALGGTVTTTTQEGKGTKFTLKLPLTLAIIEGILVQIGHHHYVIPLGNVVECLEFSRINSGDRRICSSINIRNEVIPYIDLRTFFDISDPLPNSEQIVIVTDQDSKIGLIIDKVIGNYQTVIKPLGRLYQHVAGLSGATILGDGSVALILDVYKLSDIIRELDIHNL